jgi:hypothetical protein
VRTGPGPRSRRACRPPAGSFATTSATAASPTSSTAELLVSELVGNVVLHVGGTVAVRAHATPAELLLKVIDTSPVTPQLRAFSATSGTGREMRLVHSLSEASTVAVCGPA